MKNELSATDKIKIAYYNYLRVKPYNKIKVSEVIKAAGVNRSSFYRSFEDIYSLYTAMCEELINSILLSMPQQPDPDESGTTVNAAAEKALAFSDAVKLLAGKNGNKQFLYKLRNSYYDALRVNAISSGIWTEELHYQLNFSADFLTLRLCATIMDEEYEEKNFADVDYVYDHDADPLDNISEALRALYGGTRTVQYGLLLSLVRRFSTGDSRSHSVTELFSYSGFSRTEFYRLYSHKSDYFAKLENVLCLMIIKGVLPLLAAEDVSRFTPLLNNWDKYYKEIERNAVINGLKDGYLLEFGTRAIMHLQNEYIKSYEKSIGKKVTAEQKNALSFFVTSAICCFVYYIATMDREQYFNRMSALFELKNKMLAD